MSTGADCMIIEREPGKWWYSLQDYPYGATETYTKYGPFKSEDEAINHLDKNHANPGSFNVFPLSSEED